MFKTISNTVSELLQSKMPMAEVAISGGVGEVMAGSEGSAVMIITSIVINAVFAIIKAIEKRKAEKKAEANKNF